MHPDFEERADYALPVYYMLTEAGRDLLRKHGLLEHGPVTQFGRTTHRHFAHTIMETRVLMAFIELGIKQTPRHSPVLHKDILLNPHCPDDTRRSKSPFAIPLPGSKTPKFPDNLIGWADTTSGKTLRTFACFEFDTGSEPLDPKSIDRSAIAAHFRDYLTLYRHDAFKKRFGITHVLVVFVFLSEARMRHAQDLLLRMTEGVGHGNFRFVCAPGAANEVVVPEPGRQLQPELLANELRKRT